MKARAFRALAVVAAGWLISQPAVATSRAGCDLLPERFAPASETVKRAVTTRDLIEMRDVGFPEASSTAATPLSVSPDGTQVAFTLFRAQLATNDYCRGLVVIGLHGGPPRILDRGGEQQLIVTESRGSFANYGLPRIVTPQWSIDARSIAFLRQDDGVVQIWIARTDGSGSAPLTHLSSSAEDVIWSRDGRRLIFSWRPNMQVARARIREEGLLGWHYDARDHPGLGAEPQPLTRDVPLAIWAVDANSDAISPATASDAAFFTAQIARQAGRSAVAADGNGAWLAPSNADLTAPLGLWIGRPGASAILCRWESCGTGVRNIWWLGSRLYFRRKQGWHNEETAFYEWSDPKRPPRQLIASTDAIDWCAAAEQSLVCLQENASTPRRLVRIDPRSGASALIYDPNPEFRAVALGHVRRLKWRNDRGLETWGDLVLPPGYRGQTKLPMIVVQYSSRGFLRGGTGNEYPIYLFAARGFAVLSLDHPDDVAAHAPGLRTLDDIKRVEFSEWAERRSQLSGIEGGVRAAVATGMIDGTRLGITGLSDGATSVRFALINSPLFAAAALSTCCIEPTQSMTLGGPAFADENRRAGFPGLDDESAIFWRPMSLARAAPRIDVPILMQLADEEYLDGLEAFEALREQGKPVDLYVFPDEHHGKWQPRHHLAIYERTIDWFDFWLRGGCDPDPEKAGQYRSWEAMRQGRDDQLRARAQASTSTSSNMR